jgi:hypothetical protein
MPKARFVRPFQVTLVPQTGAYSNIDLTDAAAPGGGARRARPSSNNVSWRPSAICRSITLGDRLAYSLPRVQKGLKPGAVHALELDRGPCVRANCHSQWMGCLAMTEIDWTVVGSALLLVSWFGFLLLLLYFSPAIMP